MKENIKFVFWMAFIATILWLAFRTVNGEYREFKEYEIAQEKLIRSQENVKSYLKTYFVGGDIDTLECNGNSFEIATYKLAVPVLRNAITGEEFAYNVYKYEILRNE